MAYFIPQKTLHRRSQRGKDTRRPIAISLFLTIIIITSGFSIAPAFAETNQSRALTILKEIDDLWRGESSHTVFTMRVQTQNYTRTLKLEGWSKGKDLTLVKILSPQKEKGTATLKSSNHIYTYLPRTDRTIRLTSGMMMGSWMGSHFTNDDLVKESRREDDYDIDISFEGQREGREIIEFTLIPKPDAAIVWGKVSLILREKDHIPIAEIYYDEEMQIARTITFENIKMLANLPRPSVMRVIPADKPDEFTELIYHEIQLDIDINEDFFSLSRLKRR